MSLSRPTSDKIRGQSVAWLAPLWENILEWKYFIFHPAADSPLQTLTKKEKLQQLQTENQLLLNALTDSHQLLQEQTHLSHQIQKIADFSPEEAKNILFTQGKTLTRISQELNWRAQAIPARVIFRSMDTWNSYVWINIGDSFNQAQQEKVIAKNSPVIIGRGVVGVIDYVGHHQSRIHLITSNRLNLAVRAARGGESQLILNDYVEGLLHYSSTKSSIPLPSDKQSQFISLLKEIKSQLTLLRKSKYLAKGELNGSASSFRNGSKSELKGIGFNYDFSDEEGTAKDLRTGKGVEEGAAIPLLKINDVLVTTGTDGIFPPNFHVGIVTSIDLLKEGDYFYNLSCQPIVKNLDELSIVFVLPPLSANKNEMVEFSL